ncbi:MAG: hypothetical protein ACRD5D_05865 [Candidatus Polarisedimenticolia bacterium]
MLDMLSPRERRDLAEAERRGEAWARVLARVFLEGPRLRLGIDRAPSEAEVAAAAGLDGEQARGALRAAAAWCHARGLHLMEFGGIDDAGGRRWLMAVG